MAPMNDISTTPDDESAKDGILQALGRKKEPEYIKFDKMSALVIDDISAMRGALRMQLQGIGIDSVSVASDVDGALRQISARDFDLILCDYNLNKSSTGQHFLEYLRHEGGLKAATIFIMVTAESEYDFVANAAEYTPDDYILKPCDEKRLRSRLTRLFDRRTFMLDVLKAIDSGDPQKVITECNKLLLISKNGRWVMDVLRKKAEAQLAAEDAAGALTTYRQAAGIRDDVPWVMMGIARADYALGDTEGATETAKKIVAQHPNYVAAYELLARMGVDSGDDALAYEMLNASADILPSARRLREVAEAAFLAGKLEESRHSSEAAIKMSRGTVVERKEDLLVLAQTLEDMNEHAAAISLLEKEARKYGDTGIFGAHRDAILAQAYYSSGDTAKARKHAERSQNLMANRPESEPMTALGKAKLKLGDVINGLKMMTRAVQTGQTGNEKNAIRHVTKAMTDTGHEDKVEGVIDGGRKRILELSAEAAQLMRAARFEEAYARTNEALEIHDENIDALLAAAQLHLLWLKSEGLEPERVKRARQYLATLDRLVPQNEKVMGFYRFFKELLDK